MTYTVMRDGPFWTVRYRYSEAAVAAAKLHGGRWRRSDRCWVYPDERAAERLVAELRALGYRRVGESSSPPQVTAGSWAEAMFAALPERLHEPVYRALVRVLHPDVGGDHRAAQVLNDAHRAVTT